MNSQLTGLRTAAIIFALMSIAQLVRLVMRAEVLVEGHRLPLWASAIAVVVLGGLSLWMWRLSQRST